MATTLNAITSAGGGFAVTGDSSGILGFQSAGTTYMTMTASGSLGVGTSTPTKKLQVVSDTAQDGILISGSTNPRLQVIDTTNSVTLEMISGDSQSTIRTDTNHPLVFGTYGTERMTIDTSGNVLIGAAAQVANEKLLVSGTGTQRVTIQSTSAGQPGAALQLLGASTNKNWLVGCNYNTGGRSEEHTS